MSQEREIELDVDAVFPPPGARSGMIRKPDARPPSTPPLDALPPPPPVPVALRALERIQEDVDLVIEATSRRLDDMTQRMETFEHTVRGVLGAQERRIRDLERQLEESHERLHDSHRRIAELAADLDRHETRAHELHARNAVAMARVELLERADAMRRELASLAGEAHVGLDEDDDGRESTQKIVRG